MSTVVAVQNHLGAVIGADTAIVTNSHYEHLPKEAGKIFRQQGYIVGMAGEFRPLQIIQYLSAFPEPPKKPTQVELDKFISIEFIPSIIDAYESAKYEVDVKKQNEGVDILVAVCGIIYSIGSDFSWNRNQTGHYAIGTGSPFALGALRILPTNGPIAESKHSVKKALETAAYYDINTAAPLVIYSQEVPK